MFLSLELNSVFASFFLNTDEISNHRRTKLRKPMAAVNGRGKEGKKFEATERMMSTRVTFAGTCRCNEL